MPGCGNIALFWTVPWLALSPRVGQNTPSHVSENASETQIDTTMTFTVLIVSIKQNKNIQESRVHYYTLAGIKLLLKLERGVKEPLEPCPGYAPLAVSPMFNLLQRVQVIQYMALSG